MIKSNRIASLAGSIALLAAAAASPIALPLSAAYAQAPMPAACQAASNAAQAENAQYSQPPQSAGVVVQLQHILYMTGLLLDSLDQSCRDWTAYARTRQQFQTTYDSTMQNCLAIASNAADCRRKPYGG